MRSGEVKLLADDRSHDDGVACQFLVLLEVCALRIAAAAAAAAAAVAVELEGGAVQVYQLLQLGVYVAAEPTELVHSMPLLASGEERQRPYLALNPGRALEGSMGSAVCQMFCAALHVSH